MDKSEIGTHEESNQSIWTYFQEADKNSNKTLKNKKKLVKRIFEMMWHLGFSIRKCNNINKDFYERKMLLD